MIQPSIADSRFLDLFAGSGGIGIEALSRGASWCVFVEQQRKAAECIRENLAFTRLKEDATLLVTDAVSAVNKVNEGRPHIVDMIKNNEISLVINSVEEKRQAVTDSRSIRTSALAAKVTVFTTIEGAKAACMGMRHLSGLEAYSLQALHAELAQA